jgi:chromosome segregation ATPase
MKGESDTRAAILSVHKIGGIDSAEVALQPGVTILSGRNATNRTSLLQAIMAALGSDHATLKADAEEGHAELELDGETYRRELQRSGGTIVTDGDPYLEDAELADLFAFLLESNEARRAISRGADPRELIMRPVDTAAIQSEIRDRERQKRDLEEQLDELDKLEKRLPELERERERVADEIESLRGDLEEAKTDLEETSIDISSHAEERSKLESRLEELQETRSSLERERDRIESERESIEALEEERAAVQEQLDELPTSETRDIDRLEIEIGTLQEERSELSEEISRLQTIIQFNQQLLESANGSVTDAGRDDDPLTAQLVEDSETLSCWTCGSSVAREQIEATIEQLRETRQERLEERSRISADLDDRRETLSDIEESKAEYQQTRQRLESIRAEIEKRTDTLESLQERREELANEVEDLERTIDDLEADEHGDVLARHRTANQLEFDLERAEGERDEIDEEIQSIEDRLERRDEIETNHETITDELVELRTRINQIETDAVEAFNEHMDELLEMLEYENLDRIWIDRTSEDRSENRGRLSDASFDIKVVRTTAGGSVYEDTVDHLSESEREVTGLVFALAGYLVHDVHETVPFVLLDSLEAIDAERIAVLVEYFKSHVPYLVVALLEEDARAIDVEHEQITGI